MGRPTLQCILMTLCCGQGQASRVILLGRFPLSYCQWNIPSDYWHVRLIHFPTQGGAFPPQPGHFVTQKVQLFWINCKTILRILFFSILLPFASGGVKDNSVKTSSQLFRSHISNKDFVIFKEVTGIKIICSFSHVWNNNSLLALSPKYHILMSIFRLSINTSIKNQIVSLCVSADDQEGNKRQFVSE